MAATKASGLFVVTQAGPAQAAERRCITIPGNRGIGVFTNDYAPRVLDLSTATMIEAPFAGMSLKTMMQPRLSATSRRAISLPPTWTRAATGCGTLPAIWT